MIAISFILLVLTPLIFGAITPQGSFMPMAGHRTNYGDTAWYTPPETSATYVSKRNIPPRQGRNYEDDTIGGDVKTVDLHKGEFCVDVSTYGPVEYDHVPKETCDSTFSKQCEDRSERVITAIPQFNGLIEI